IKAVRLAVGSPAWFPYHFTTHIFLAASFTFFRCRALVLSPATVLAFPVKCVKIAHYRHHCDVIPSLFERFQHFTIKSLVKRAMSIDLHHIASFGQLACKICGLALANGFWHINHIYSFMLNNRGVGSLAV